MSVTADLILRRLLRADVVAYVCCYCCSACWQLSYWSYLIFCTARVRQVVCAYDGQYSGRWFAFLGCCFLLSWFLTDSYSPEAGSSLVARRRWIWLVRLTMCFMLAAAKYFQLLKPRSSIQIQYMSNEFMILLCFSTVLMASQRICILLLTLSPYPKSKTCHSMFLDLFGWQHSPSFKVFRIFHTYTYFVFSTILYSFVSICHFYRHTDLCFSSVDDNFDSRLSEIGINKHGSCHY